MVFICKKYKKFHCWFVSRQREFFENFKWSNLMLDLTMDYYFSKRTYINSNNNVNALHVLTSTKSWFFSVLVFEWHREFVYLKNNISYLFTESLHCRPISVTFIVCNNSSFSSKHSMIIRFNTYLSHCIYSWIKWDFPLNFYSWCVDMTKPSLSLRQHTQQSNYTPNYTEAVQCNEESNSTIGTFTHLPHYYVQYIAQ